MHRLFVALHPPEPVREALLDTMEGLEGARWQDSDNLHLTLRFAGEVETPLANDLADALLRVAMPPFLLALHGVGHFESKGRPHAIWAAVAPSSPLLLLRDKVEHACRAAGLPPETRKFVPHVTLARLGRTTAPIAPWLAAHGRLSAGPWLAESFVLYESHLGREGPHYEPVARYPLG